MNATWGALVWLLGASACAHSVKGDMGVHQDEMQQLLEQAYGRMATEQVEALLSLYAEDAIIQSSGEAAVIGKPAIAQFWRNTFANFRVHLAPQVQECTAFGEIVVVRGRATGTFEPKAAGTTLPIDSWFLQVYRRDAHGRLFFWRGSNGPLAPTL